MAIKRGSFGTLAERVDNSARGRKFHDRPWELQIKRVARPRFERAFVGCSDIAMTLISALRRNVSTSRRALTIALTIGGGFGRIRAVSGGRKGQ